MKKKRRGSTAIAVVIIFSLIMLVGEAMLTMTLGDYRMRINEGNRIKNLYGSDSGLDAAYGIIVKTFDAATQYGRIKAEEFKEENVDKNGKNGYEFNGNVDFTSKIGNDYLSNLKEIDKRKAEIKKIENKQDKEKIIELKREIQAFESKVEDFKDKEFKRAFDAFINNEKNKEEFKDINIKSNSILVDKILQESISKKVYVNEVKKEDVGIKFIMKKIELDENKNIEEPKVWIYGFDTDYNSTDEPQAYTIRVKSKFSTDTTKIADKKNRYKNERILESDYTMNIPNRNDVSFSEPKINKIKCLEDKGIIVNGDMHVENSGDSDANKLSINGDVYVCGTDKNNKGVTDKAYKKYLGGIDLNSSYVDFNGNVITARTLNIKDNVDCKIFNNLFAKNIYADGKNENENDKSELKIELYKEDSNKGQAIIDNDITLNAKNTKIKMNYFYGINEKNIGDNSPNNEKSKLNATSSSIIVNGNEKSGVVVNKEAYIMGVANINTNSSDEDGGYVTGESTGVKGNYIAYAAQTDSDDRFKYYDPLMLLDNDKSVEEKKKHFEKYWNDTSKLNHGGIELPKEETYASGAIVCKGSNNEAEILQSKSEDKLNETIRNKKIEYVKNVYSLNNKGGDYEATKLVSNVLDDIIEFKIDDLKDKEGKDLYDLDKAIKKDKKLIFIKGNKENETDKTKIILQSSNDDKIETSGEKITINAIKDKDGKGILNAVIITDGDVEIKDNIKFTGAIMCNGDLKIEGNGVSITHSKEVVNAVQNDNRELFNKLFIPQEDEKNDEENSQSSGKEIKVDYDINKFIKTNMWKIIK